MAEPSNFVKAYIARRKELEEVRQYNEQKAQRDRQLSFEAQRIEESRQARAAQEAIAQQQFEQNKALSQRAAAQAGFGLQAQGLARPATEPVKIPDLGQPGPTQQYPVEGADPFAPAVSGEAPLTLPPALAAQAQAEFPTTMTTPGGTPADVFGGTSLVPTNPYERAQQAAEVTRQQERIDLDQKRADLEKFAKEEDLDEDQRKELLGAALFHMPVSRDTVDAIRARALKTFNDPAVSPERRVRAVQQLQTLYNYEAGIAKIRAQANPMNFLNYNSEEIASQLIAEAQAKLRKDLGREPTTKELKDAIYALPRPADVAAGKGLDKALDYVNKGPEKKGPFDDVFQMMQDLPKLQQMLKDLKQQQQPQQPK